MKMQKQLFTAFRGPDVELSAGFYGRVMNRIETQAKPSIWSLFGESVFAKRLAYASIAFVALLGTYVISSSRTDRALLPNSPESMMASEDNKQERTITNTDPDRDRAATLVTLASYQE